MNFLFLLAHFLFPSSQASIIQAIHNCYPADELKKQILIETELHNDLRGPDLNFRLTSGYSKNEVSSANPERVQYGASVRWTDVTGRLGESDLQETMGQIKTSESKLLLENFWRLKLQDLYYWKWGKDSEKDANQFLEFSKGKLLAGEQAFVSLAATRTYSDLLELNRLSSEFVGKMAALNSEFSICKDLSSWETKLDFTQEQINSFAQKEVSRLTYQDNFCAANKKAKTISLYRESAPWTLGLNSSFTRNSLLKAGTKDFNDLRVGVELSIPLNMAKASAIVIDRCDYEIKILKNQHLVDQKTSELLYPSLDTIQRQFLLIKKKLRTLDLSSKSNGIITADIVTLGINFFRTHESLASGEGKMNAHLLSTDIVENEL